MMTETTLTHEFSALQVKIMYLHFKFIRINSSIRKIGDLNFANPASPEALSTRGEIVYDLIDGIVIFENYHTVVDELLKFRDFPTPLPLTFKDLLKNIRKQMQKWKHIRNKIGGHLDMEPIVKMCAENNFRGVFISDHLDVDFKAALLSLMLESAINETLDKSKLFNRKLKLMKLSDMKIFVEKFNQDWDLCLKLFDPAFKFFYDIGKEEKLSRMDPSSNGIIKF